MSEKLVKIKENKKSEVYENDEYEVRILEINGCFYRQNGADYTPYDYDLPDDACKFVDAVTLKIKNKSTGKVSQKRCYQGYAVINDIQRDLEGDKTQFSSIFQKIDKV